MSCKETVTVGAEAVNWLKEKYPELCIKAGLCERIAGRLYTKTLSAPPAQTPPPRLTEHEMNAACKSETGCWMCPTGDDLKFARAIESAVRKQFGVNDE